jgi:hypothetical protein
MLETGRQDQSARLSATDAAPPAFTAALGDGRESSTNLPVGWSDKKLIFL